MKAVYFIPKGTNYRIAPIAPTLLLLMCGCRSLPRAQESWRAYGQDAYMRGLMHR